MLDQDSDELNDRTIEQANSILGRRYHAQIAEIVADLRDCIKSGEVMDTDGAQDWLHETLDGHQWVIYTHYNFDVLRYSSNHDAAADEYGGEELIKDGDMNWALLAYCAMEADVREEIGDFGDLFLCAAEIGGIVCGMERDADEHSPATEMECTIPEHITVSSTEECTDPGAHHAFVLGGGGE